MYICECGREFDTPQSFNGHKSHCTVHHLSKYGNLDKSRDYPTEQTRKRISQQLLKAGAARKEMAKKLWTDEPHYCERCSALMPIKYGSGRFCSKACANSRTATEEANRKRSAAVHDTLLKKKGVPGPVYAICPVCGQEFERQRSKRGLLSKRKTCSQECLNKLNKQHLSLAGQVSVESQMRRSINEIYFYELCCNEFMSVKHNEPMFNGWDADVIIEDIKYAVLWNGPWHYKQLKAGQSLTQIQTRDRLKQDRIKACGYTPYVIQDMGSANSDFVKEQFDLFLNHIREL